MISDFARSRYWSASAGVLTWNVVGETIVGLSSLSSEHEAKTTKPNAISNVDFNIFFILRYD